MAPTTPGIHHVTTVGSDPGQNRQFYTETLGLRLVKQSVNQDDVSVYHLFYGDRSGTPGTSMTVFPYPGARSGQVGTGQVSTVAFHVPADSIDYWQDRLARRDVEHDEPRDRFGTTVLPLRDPDGLPLELVADGTTPESDPWDETVPEEHAIRGFYGVTLSLASTGPTLEVLEDMGYEQRKREGDRRRLVAGNELGSVIDVREDPTAPRGRPGAGTVHHVAFRSTDEQQPEWQELLRGHGLRPTEVIDRKWFRSVYVREHSGVLFEFATEEPGYTVDEELEELGNRLVLPEWLEDRREEIEAGLPDLRADATTPQ
jgi:glyoxalase family protein